jgi:hypothetical protein
MVKTAPITDLPSRTSIQGLLLLDRGLSMDEVRGLPGRDIMLDPGR